MARNIKIENKFDTISVDNLSKENIFKYFFFSKQKAILVVNEWEQLYGIITLGDFIKNNGEIMHSLNKNNLFIKNGVCEKMLIEAQRLFDKFNIESIIPIISENRKIIGYLYDKNNEDNKNRQYLLKVNEFKNKFLNVQSSFYLSKEIEAFLKITEKTDIYVNDCKTLQELIPIFGWNIVKKFIVLNDEEFYNRIQIEKENDLKSNEKTCIMIDFGFNNRRFLYNALYDIEKFIKEFFDCIEKGDFSKIIRITENPYYSLADHVYDHGWEKLSYPAHKFSTNFLYSYLKNKSYYLTLNSSEAYYGIQASWLTNGIRGSGDRVDVFSTCDLIGQQIVLNKSLSKKRIKILNLQAATKTKLTESEKRRFRIYNGNLMDLDNQSIEELYGENKTDYVKKISYTYPVTRRFEHDLILNVDFNSEFINFENGIRKTFYQSKHYLHTIYLIGPCFALGYCVEDKYTIPSILAKILVENGYSYRIVNLGALISNNIQDIVENINLHDGDIIINLLTTIGDRVKKHIDIIETDPFFDGILNRSDMFFDLPFHCNEKGNEIYAKVLFQNLQSELKRKEYLPYEYSAFDIFTPNSRDLQSYNFSDYMLMLKKEKQVIPPDKKVIGSIVMNANPFTYGHEYLVDYALNHCDWLYLFVVQENKSFFQFEDRFHIIRENCKNKKNISIVPSGKMIISSVTFPEYFKKEAIHDNMENRWNERINIELDFRLFATYIAPALGITKRFVGEEPSDLLTRKYNKYMKKILSAFNIDVVEIPRKKANDNSVISASTVRRLYKEKNFEKIKEIVPEVTFQFLIENLNMYINNKERKYEVNLYRDKRI